MDQRRRVEERKTRRKGREEDRRRGERGITEEPEKERHVMSRQVDLYIN